MSRVQMIMRRWATGETAVHGYGSTRTVPLDGALVLATGLIETPVGTIGDDVMLPMFHDAPTDRMVFGKPSSVADDRIHDEVALAKIGAWMRHEVWQGLDLPSMPLAVGGRVAARRCAMPTVDGHEAHLLLGILAVGRGVLRTENVLLEGTGGRDLRFLVSPSDRTAALPPMGNAGDKIFEMPNWGWEPEPMAFQSSMRMDVMEKMDRICVLRLLEDPTAEERDELVQLGRSAGGLGLDLLRDKEFKRFLKLQAAVAAPALPISSPVSSEWLAVRSLVAEAVVTCMREEDDHAALAAIRNMLASSGHAVPDAGSSEVPAPGR